MNCHPPIQVGGGRILGRGISPRVIFVEGNYIPVCSEAFERQRRGVSVAQGVSPGMVTAMALNPLSLRERAGVREFL